MKISILSKIVGAGVVAASLAVVPFTVPAQAQNQNTQNTAPGTYTQPNAEVEDVETEDGFDWGWLGLLGLAGLAGLAPKKRQEPVRTYQASNDPDVKVRPGSDYR